MSRSSWPRSSWIVALVATAIVAGSASNAEAAWGLRNSFGQGFWLVPPTVTNPVTITDPTNPNNMRSVLPKCAGLCYDGNRRLPIDFEVMPYYGFGLVSLDLGIAFNLESRNDLGFNFHFRPGVRVFPILGLYVRGYLDLTAAQLGTGAAGAVSATFEGNLAIGVGYQFRLGPWGVFLESNFSPRVWGSGPFSMPVDIRLGWLLEP